MATETFNYDRQAGAVGSVTFRTREIAFGDGYSQAVADGLNNEVHTWPLTFEGDLAAVQPIIDFFRRHKGYKSFYWTPPGTPQSLFRVKTYSITSVGGGVYKVSAEFSQVYAL